MVYVSRRSSVYLPADYALEKNLKAVLLTLIDPRGREFCENWH